jgi:hypothetical protein
MQKDIAFAMDECARETTLEAMQQNNIRPFDEARSMIEITDVTIPPPDKKKKKTKKKSVEPAPEVVDEKEPEWLMFDNMNGAIDAGWKVRTRVCLMICLRTRGYTDLFVSLA